MSNQIISSDLVVHSDQQTLAWGVQNTRWVFSLFGTAVGAGILFLPMNAGQGGPWPLICMILLVGPMTYLAHRGLALLVASGSSGSQQQHDLTQVVTQHFGKNFGFILTLGYFFAIYPILLIYGVSLTNTVEHYFAQHLQWHAPRWLLSFSLVSMMMAVMVAGERFMLRITQFLVYPLVLFLFSFAVYLIPQWNLSTFSQVPTVGSFAKTLWLTLPVLVFSFNHSPAISSFVRSQLRLYQQQDAIYHIQAILKTTTGILVFFVMFFVCSCVFSLTPEQLSMAKTQNISILSIFIDSKAYPFMSHLAPFVALIAIVSSFFGHYLGAQEGLNAILLRCLRQPKHGISTLQLKQMQGLSTAFLFLTLWGVAAFNPSILGLIESLVGPIIACILFLLPMYAFAKIPSLQKYKGTSGYYFIIVIGVAVVSAMLHRFFNGG